MKLLEVASSDFDMLFARRMPALDRRRNALISCENRSPFKVGTRTTLHLRALSALHVGAHPPASHQNGSAHVNPASASPATSLTERIKRSFRASFGNIVFGMEDGTVSIFGLVFGVAASTDDGRIVLLQTLGIAAAAGAAGVIVGRLFA